MNIDQYALAQMALASLLLGAFLELVFELLRFAGGIFMPRLLCDTNENNDDAVAVIWFSVRDFVFFIILRSCVFGIYILHKRW